MATSEAVLAALAELREDLDTGAWVPDEYDGVIAVVVGAEGGASADAIRAALRSAGPDGSHARLAPVVARCAYLLEAPSRAASADGRAVKAALDELLDLVVLAGVRRS